MITNNLQINESLYDSSEPIYDMGNNFIDGNIQEPATISSNVYVDSNDLSEIPSVTFKPLDKPLKIDFDKMSLDSGYINGISKMAGLSNIKNLNYIQDFLIRKNVPYALRIAILATIIKESGGNLGPHGNGAYGLIGYKDDRYRNMLKYTTPNDIKSHTQYLYDGLYDNKEGSNGWLSKYNNLPYSTLFLKSDNVNNALRYLTNGFIRVGDKSRFLIAQYLHNFLHRK